MFSRNLSKRLYLFITIIVSIQCVYFTLNAIISVRESVIHEIENDLVRITILLEQKLPSSYNELLTLGEGNSSSNTEKIRILNQSLQPIVESISKAWPGYGIGYYSIDQKIVALVPFNKDMLGKTASTEALKVYEQKELQITRIKNAFTWGSGSTVIGANYPIFHNGVLIGHVWANIKTNNINSSVIKEVSELIVEYFVVWVVLILILGWGLRKTNEKITELISQITNDTVDVSKFSEIPELIPVLETIEKLKTNLKNEYEERERVKEEIGRLDRLNTVGEMAATLAHEIRNPMTVVMGYAQLISSKNNNFAEQFSIIINELKRVNVIIEDFLSLSRNKHRLVTDEQINDIIQSFHPLIYAEATKKGITIDMELQPNLPRIHVNKAEITQLILNLVRNSIEVTNSLGTVKICTKYCENDKKYISLIISDMGCGIAKEDIPKIFTAFYTTKTNGTGLGLPVCKNIVDNHKGEITFSSIVGEGTTCTVNLPCKLD